MSSEILISEVKRYDLMNEIEKWNQFEKTSFLIESIKLLNYGYLKFVTSICNNLLEKPGFNDQSSTVLEEQANDISYFDILNKKPIDKKYKIIFSYLPLLDCKSEMKDKLKQNYYELIKELSEYSLINNTNLNETRHIVQFAYLHPIFDIEQKSMFKKWTQLLEESILKEIKDENESLIKKTKDDQIFFDEPQILINNCLLNQNNQFALNKSNESNYSIPSDNSESLFSDYIKLDSNGSMNNLSNSIGSNICSLNSDILPTKQHLPLKNSSSLPPFSSVKILNDPNQKNIASLVTKNKMNNSTNSIISNDFELDNSNRFDQKRNSNFSNYSNDNRSYCSKIISQWLKNLRLHKYTNLLASLTYDELIDLTDEKLLDLNITMGARKKILTNIEKLKKRNEKLKELNKNFEQVLSNQNNSDLKIILEELMDIALSPMRPHDSPPSSLAKLNDLSNSLNEEEYKNDNEKLCKKIIELLHKIQKYLENKKSILALLSDESEEKIFETEYLKELILIYLKVIDKLFLTKAFNDIQQTHLSRLRNSLHDKEQIRTKSPTCFISNSSANIQAKSSNFINARQRIQNKNFKNVLGRTSSAPFNQTTN